MSTNAPVRLRRDGIPLGRIAGVPIVLAYSWFLIAAFTVFTFGPRLLGATPRLGVNAYLIALAYALLLLFSVLVHELAHALMARKFGWPTQKIVLNLWGGHTQFENFTATPARSLLVAFAGPVANFVLAGAGWLAITAIPADSSSLAMGVLGLLANIFMWANLLIGAFNVLPGLPLDGGRLVESIVWKATGSQEKGTVAAGWAGRILVVLLLFASIVLPLAQGSQPDSFTLLLSIFIAGFLWMGASQSISAARIRLRLPQISAGKLADPAAGMPATASVAQLAAVRAANPHLRLVLFNAEGRPEYVVDNSVLDSVPASAASTTSGVAVARSLAPGAYVPETAEGQELIQYLAQLAGGEYAVINIRGQVTGLLSQSVVVAAVTGKRDPRQPR